MLKIARIVFEWIKHHQKWLLCIPAPLCLLIVAFLVGRALIYSDKIDGRYRDGARKAMEAEDYEKARVYYSRLVESGEAADPQDRLNWAKILGQAGESAAARAILTELAPDATVGYGPAHRQRALILTAESERTPDPAILEQLYWHLRHGAREDTAEAHRLWASYFLKVNKPQDAVSRLESAARKDPNLWLTAARLAGAVGQTDSMNRFLDRAKVNTKTILDSNPHDVQQRLMLVQAMVQEDQLDEAERVLAEGLRVVDDPTLRRACSDLMLLKFDRTNDDDISVRVSYLSEASKFDANNPAIYARMVGFYQSQKSDAAKKGLRSSLQRAIVQGKGTAFAHFALGSVFWLEKDQKQSLFHLEKAFELAPQMLDVANNLAWLLAKGPEPDLERAEELIRSAIEKRPNDVRYHDTLAGVLEESQRWDEALVELEKVLSATSGRTSPDLHKRLATVYRALGNKSMAEMHEEEAEQLGGKK